MKKISLTSPVLKDDLAFDLVANRLSYSAETGVLTWKKKDGASANAATWNARYAGMSAGSVGHDGYITVSLFGKHYRAHRVAWLLTFGFWPSRELDHRNGDKADNRISNLRQATKAQNAINSGLPANNASGHRGVHWHAGAKKWRARIKVSGKCVHLGFFQDIGEAASAYSTAASSIFGDFAREVSR